MNQRDKVFMTFGAVALIAAAGVGGYMIFKPASESATPTVATSRTVSGSTDSVSSSTNSSTTVANSTSASYKDGTYTATTSYMMPHGATNSLQATVVVLSGKITSVKTNDTYSDRESAEWISEFEAAVSSDANGQSLADYSPSRVGGASLTTSAFDDVLDTIRSNAKA